MNHLQKRRLLLAFIMLWFSIFIIWVYQMNRVNANWMEYAERIVIGVNYFPPRIQQLCSDAYIGVEYNPRIEKRCRVLWDSWTKEIITNNL